MEAFNKYHYAKCFNTGNNAEVENFAHERIVVTTSACLDRNHGLDISRFDEIIGYYVADKNWQQIKIKYEQQKADRLNSGFRNNSNFSEGIMDAAAKFVENRVSPVKLEVILHSHYSPECLAEIADNKQSPAIEDAIRFWIKHDMLVLMKEDDCENGDGELYWNVYTTTEKGRAYIEGLCQMPFPVPSWSIPRLAQ
jgi:hypothetical protein